MGIKRLDLLIGSFRLSCWLATMSMSLMWIYKFSLNEDLCEINYRNYYQTKEDEYPVLSLCFDPPVTQEKLNEFANGLNKTNYMKFLEGKHFDSKLLDIDYKSVSLNQSYYIRSNWIRWRDGSYVENTSDSKIAPFLEESYSGFDNYKVFMKCYALKLPDDVYFLNGTVQDFGLLISNDIFPSGRRPLLYGISTLIHYPNQLLRSYETQRYSWDQRSNDSEIAMRFKIKGMEIIRHRNKNSQPCHEDWKNDDDHIITKHVNNVGCRAPYQKVNNKIKKCKTIDKLAESRFVMSTSGYKTYPPCKIIGKLDYILEESEVDTSKPGNFWIGIWINGKQFKEIIRKRAIDINGLIGNIGGYIGLCLRYSILQIPEFISILFVYMRKKFPYLSSNDLADNGIIQVERKTENSANTDAIEKNDSRKNIFNDVRCLKDEVKDINTKLDHMKRSIDALITGKAI